MCPSLRGPLQSIQPHESCRFYCMDPSKVAKERPIEVEESSTFVVDLTCLQHPDDMKDMYGWDYSGSHPEVFRCTFHDFDNISIEKCAVGATSSNIYFRWLIVFVHGEEATL